MRGLVYMASRDKVDVDTFHKGIKYALEKLGKSKFGFERTAVSNFKSKRHVGSGNEIEWLLPELSFSDRWSRNETFSRSLNSRMLITFFSSEGHFSAQMTLTANLVPRPFLWPSEVQFKEY